LIDTAVQILKPTIFHDADASLRPLLPLPIAKNATTHANLPANKQQQCFLVTADAIPPNDA